MTSRILFLGLSQQEKENLIVQFLGEVDQKCNQKTQEFYAWLLLLDPDESCESPLDWAHWGFCGNTTPLSPYKNNTAENLLRLRHGISIPPEGFSNTGLIWTVNGFLAEL